MGYMRIDGQEHAIHPERFLAFTNTELNYFVEAFKTVRAVTGQDYPTGVKILLAEMDRQRWQREELLDEDVVPPETVD